MGVQNGKQMREISSVDIDHPIFKNAMILQQKGSIFMITTMGIDESKYKEWKKKIQNLKYHPSYLMMQKNHQFEGKNFCGSAGTLTIMYDYFPYLLKEEIQNRLKRNSKFQECELWFLLYSLSAAQNQMKKAFDSKLGDIRPENIFINQEGQIKVSCLHSWPNQTTAFEKSFQKQPTLLSPEDMNRLELGGINSLNNYQSEIFSIGMTILSAAFLSDFSDLYDMKRLKFCYDKAQNYLNRWKNNKIYSEILTAFVSNLCSFEPENRLTQKELWSFINKYEDQIKNKEDFQIDKAPIKIEKQIDHLRQINLLNLSYFHNPYNINTNNYLQNSQSFSSFQGPAPYPFLKGHPNQKIEPVKQKILNLTQNIPIQLNTLNQINYKKKIIELPNHNITAAESIYATMPPEFLQKKIKNEVHTNIQMKRSILNQFSQNHVPNQFNVKSQQIPQLVAGNKFLGQGLVKNEAQIKQKDAYLIGQRQLLFPTNSLLSPSTAGNFIYTRRLIDPKTGAIFGQQRIGQDQYERGISQIDLSQEH